MEFEFSVQIIDKFIGGGLVFIYLAAFLMNFESLHLANKLVEFVWDSEPDIFNGKFGQRPHKMTVAAYALANGVDLVAKDKQIQNTLVIGLSTILSEVQTNGALYPLNSLDHQLLETSMAIFLEFSQELDESPLGKEIDMFMDIASEPTDKLPEWYKPSEQGNAEVQCNLGVIYATGIGVAENEAQAVVWFLRKAAEQGDAEAQCNLGVIYATSIGVAKNEAQAVVWFRKAAEQGDAEAQCNLGVMYYKGTGIVKDDVQAVIWWRKAAEQGHAKAQYLLWMMYGKGNGIAKDEAQAVVWCRKAAEQGHAEAQYSLGNMYADGIGVAKNEAQAVAWYCKAAEQGYAKAQFNLGFAYANGKGVTQNLELAVMWCRKASEQELEEPSKTNILVLLERLKNEIS